MDLNKENIKKIRGIIIFTALLIVCLWKYDVVFEFFALSLVLPFPSFWEEPCVCTECTYEFFQRHLFPEERIEKTKVA